MNRIDTDQRAPGRKNHHTNGKAEFLQQTWPESEGAGRTNPERQVGLKLGRTGKTMGLGTYEVSELSRLLLLGQNVVQEEGSQELSRSNGS